MIDYKNNDIYEYVATRLVNGRWERGYATGKEAFGQSWGVGKNPNFDALLYKCIMVNGGFNSIND